MINPKTIITCAVTGTGDTTSETADVFLALIGSDLAYVKTGFSY